MRIAFLDSSSLYFGPQSLHEEALGGSVSTFLLLTQALAQAGHHVQILARASSRFVDGECDLDGRVWCDRESFCLEQTEALIVSGAPESLWEYRWPAALPCFFWCHNYHPRYPVKELSRLIQAGRLQGILFVSAWQARTLQELALSQGVPLPSRCCHVFGPAHHPAFNLSISTPEALLAMKSSVLRLIYTSVPGRGLGVLLSIWPALKQRFPRLELQVYSSLGLYQEAEYDAHYAPLFEEIERLDGVSSQGLVPAQALACALQQAHVLAYPSLGKEAAGLVVLEAQAAGLQVVCSDYGALPENVVGLPHLCVPVRSHSRFPFDYFDALSTAVWNWQQRPLWMARQALRSAQAQQAQSWQERAHWLVKILAKS